MWKGRRFESKERLCDRFWRNQELCSYHPSPSRQVNPHSFSEFQEAASKKGERNSQLTVCKLWSPVKHKNISKTKSFFHETFFEREQRSLSIGYLCFCSLYWRKKDLFFLSWCLGEGNQAAVIYLYLCNGGKASFIPSTGVSSSLQGSSKMICFLHSQNSLSKKRGE